ncbi:MAG: rhodanese-like domain-containing protein [Bacteroidota bacterium]
MDINVTELKRKLDQQEKFVFIDVREQYEFDEANLGAQLIPLGDIPGKLADLKEHKDEEIVVHCRSGRRSAMAQELMRQAGFSKVRNLEGGILAWIETFGSPVK